MSTPDPLPSYEPILDAFHRAFAPELRAMVGSLPIAEGDSVLEMACGDGAYTPWLADRVGPRGSVVAVDVSPAYLAVAKGGEPVAPGAGRVIRVAASIEHLPLPRGSFDLVWCAQSLYSLPDQGEAVRTMAELVRPGGAVAVLENDTIHQVILPWPPDVELAVRAAELVAFRGERKPAERFYVGRWLPRLFRACGLGEIAARSFASTRLAPLGDAERAFLNGYLADISGRIADRLPAEVRDRFAALAGGGIVDDPDLMLTVVDHIVIGRRPA